MALKTQFYVHKSRIVREGRRKERTRAMVDALLNALDAALSQGLDASTKSMHNVTTSGRAFSLNIPFDNIEGRLAWLTWLVQREKTCEGVRRTLRRKYAVACHSCSGRRYYC